MFTIQNWKSANVVFLGETVSYGRFIEKRVDLMEKNQNITFILSNIANNNIIEEKLQLPFVHYPSYSGTFLAFSETKSSAPFLCSCMKEPVTNFFAGNFGKHYSQDGFLKFFPNINKNNFVFHDMLCHKCNKTIPYMQYSAYGSQFSKSFGWYINQEALRHKINPYDSFSNKDIWHSIENKTRQDFDFANIGSCWVSETKLYNIVCSLYPQRETFRHYRPEWLNRLELDIFIPSLNLAFEYQGEQHFKPIDHWGGEAAYLKQRENDSIKARICQERGIDLLYVNYFDDFDEEFVKNMIENTTIGKMLKTVNI
jgi:hypothetical protein